MPSRRNKPSYTEIIVESWEDFAQTVFHPRYVNWVFRGHNDARWSLESTLGRRLRNAKIDQRAWSAQELRILNVFKRKAHLFLEHVPADNDSFQWLALMQHHGAPTRLLDFTWSPYVASFFSLESATADAVIWAVNQPALTREFKINTGGRPKVVKPWLMRPRKIGNYEKYFVRGKHPFVVWDTPYVMNQRLIAQSGTFLVPSTLEEPVEDILSRYSQEVIVKFTLRTSKLRETAMLELYRMNITHYTLFPGLDGLARSMGYEAEFSRARNPRTMKQSPGWDSPGLRGDDFTRPSRGRVKAV